MDFFLFLRKKSYSRNGIHVLSSRVHYSWQRATYTGHIRAYSTVTIVFVGLIHVTYESARGAVRVSIIPIRIMQHHCSCSWHVLQPDCNMSYFLIFPFAAPVCVPASGGLLTQFLTLLHPVKGQRGEDISSLRGYHPKDTPHCCQVTSMVSVW